MRWCALLLASLFAISAPAQQQKQRSAPIPKLTPPVPVPATKFPIEKLQIEGNRRFPAEKIILASGLKIGQGVDKDDFESARKRLLDTGAFESVGYEYKPSTDGKGFEATIQVVEVMSLFHYRFEDLPASEQTLRAAIAQQEPLFGDEIPATRIVMERYERALTQALEGKVKIESKLSADLPGEPQIVFRQPGDRPRVSEVHFTGNELIPSTALINRFAEVAIGAEFTEANMRVLLDTSVRPLYEARGRLRVAFPKIQSEKSKEPGVNGIALWVTVAEGPSYNLGEVQLAGVPRDKVVELQKLANWRTKELANFDEIKSGVDRIVKRYRSGGYLYVESRVDRTIHDQEMTVDLLVTINPGAQYTFGKLDIQGLDINSEPAIRKMWGDRTGKPFDPEFPNAFLKNIRDQGLFDNLGETDAQTKIDESSRIADVTLIFHGAPPPKDSRRPRLGQPF